MNRRCALAPALVAIALAPWGTALPPAQAQGNEPLPCNLTLDRTVAPLDIVVDENVHVEIQIEGVCDRESKGVDVFFVVDRSNAMFDKGYIDSTRQALIAFVNAMDFTKGAAGLITYAASDSVRSNLTKDQDKILAAINSIRRAEESDVRALQTGFRKATQKLDNDGTPGNDKVIMIIAAGPDIDGHLINMPTVTQAARNADMKVIFLMFPDARYQHFVEASSDCTLAFCPTWNLGGGRLVQKWAFPVDPNTIVNMVGNTLKAALLFGPDIASLEVYEAMDSGAVFDVASSIPLPNRPAGPPYVDVIWTYTGVPGGAITIEYDAQMIYGDTTYTVTDVSRVTVLDSLGQSYVANLPNPLVTVHAQGTATPTVTATATESATPTATVVTPTPTETPPDDHPVFLPLLLKAFDLIDCPGPIPCP